MKLKHWQGNDNKLSLRGSDHSPNRIISVKRVAGGFRFREECDSYFVAVYAKADALALVDELRRWIKDEDNKQ